MATKPVVPLASRLRQLRADRGMSRSQLARQTVRVDPAGVGLPEVTIKDLETRPRQAKAATMELLALALDVEPETFVEYRLAIARRALDERQVGLEAAAAMLSRTEGERDA